MARAVLPAVSPVLVQLATGAEPALPLGAQVHGVRLFAFGTPAGPSSGLVPGGLLCAPKVSRRHCGAVRC